jgi:hypothetical protein
MTAAFQAIPPIAPLERRRGRRIQVSLQVEVELSGERRAARMTEVSRAGARLEQGEQGATGDSVILRCNGVTLEAKIVWTDHSGTGLWFPEALDETSFLQLRSATSA